MIFDLAANVQPWPWNHGCEDEDVLEAANNQESANNEWHDGANECYTEIISHSSRQEIIQP